MGLTTVNEVSDNLEVETRLTKKVIVLSGQDLTRGDLVKIESGKVLQWAAADGAADAYTVMHEDVDATGGDTVGLAYRDAELLASEVDFNDGADSTAIRDVLDSNNIFLLD